MLCSKIYCACNCGNIIKQKSDVRYYKAKYINGHYWNGKRQSEEIKIKRGLYKNGIEASNYKDGRCLKKYYCSCGEKIRLGAKRCRKCANKLNSFPKYTQFKKGRIPWNKGLTKKDHYSIRDSSIRFKKYNATKDQYGEKNPAWKGGKSFEPYPLGWTKIFKEQIRYRDNYTCKLCNTHEVELCRKLAIHHIDYDKSNLNPSNLISLCHRCHPKTNTKREFWIEYFQSEK